MQPDQGENINPTVIIAGLIAAHGNAAVSEQLTRARQIQEIDVFSADLPGDDKMDQDDLFCRQVNSDLNV